MRPDKKRRNTLLAFTIVVAIALCWAAWPSRPLLLERASEVANIHNWNANEYPAYWWLSSHELLLFRNVSSGQPNDPYIFDISIGRIKSLARLKQVTEHSGGVSNLKISPDGQWLLWNNGDDIFIATLDGSHYAKYPKAWPSLWLSDSRHWIQFAEGRQAIIHDDASSEVQRVPVVAQNSFPSPIYEGVHANNKFYDVRWDGSIEEPVSQVKIVESQLNKGLVPIRQNIVPLPPRTKLYDLCISPSGKYVAWLLGTQQVPFLNAFLHHLLPSIKSQSQSFVCVYVSNLDGTNMSEVGYLRIPAEASFNRRVTNLSWLPDGRYLSFVYQQAVWIVPIN